MDGKPGQVEDLEIRKTGRFEFCSTPLDGLWVVQRKPIDDRRGFLCRLFCAQEFRTVGLVKPLVQINHTLTVKEGALRGLHFQHPPHAEWKMVSCLRGAVFDVAVDIRKHSPTFLQWHGEVLSPENKKSLLIPTGFAHGFQTLTRDCELIYLHSEPYCAEAEGALNVKDPAIGVTWPAPVTEISDRDRGHPFLTPTFEGIVP